MNEPLKEMYSFLDEEYINRLTKKEMRSILIELIKIKPTDSRFIFGSTIPTDLIADIIRQRI